MISKIKNRYVIGANQKLKDEYTDSYASVILTFLVEDLDYNNEQPSGC